MLTAQGQACTSNTNSQCVTGNYVDGICCGPTCSDTCQSCAIVKPGLVNGTGGLVSVGEQTTNGCNSGILGRPARFVAPVARLALR